MSVAYFFERIFEKSTRGWCSLFSQRFSPEDQVKFGCTEEGRPKVCKCGDVKTFFILSPFLKFMIRFIIKEFTIVQPAGC